MKTRLAKRIMTVLHGVITRWAIRHLLFFCKPSSVLAPVLIAPALEPDQAFDVLEANDAGETRNQEHDAEPGDARCTDNSVVETDGPVGADLGEEEGVDGAALDGVGRIRLIVGAAELGQVVVDAIDPEPKAEDADGKTHGQSEMGAEAAKHADRPGAVDLVQPGAVAPQTQDAKDGAAA